MTDTTIPLEALDNHIAILAKTGSGKSNAAKVVVEGLLDRGERVCVIDPTGTWYGLRLTPKRKPSGYKVAIFGGAHADLAIGGTHGAAIAEVVGTSATSAIIDTRQMTVKDRTRFFTDFAERLLQTNQGKLHLVVDEAHVFMPKGKVADPASGQMLHAGSNLVSLGRGNGLCITLITQRPAKLHNDALGQVETLVAMRMLLPHDKDAVMDWVRDQADPARGKEIVASLANLKTGDAWVWCPGLDLLERRHFPLVKTFDSGRPDTSGQGGPVLQPLDMSTITERLEAVAADVVANDPRHLKAELARLRAEAAKSVEIRQNPAETAEAEARGYDRGLAEGKAEVLEAYRAGQVHMRVRAAGAAADAIAALERDGGPLPPFVAAAASFQVAKSDMPPLDPMNLPDNPGLRPGPMVRERAPPRPPAFSDEDQPRDTVIKPAHQKILDALAWNENILHRQGAARPKVSLAFDIGMNAAGGGFNNYLGVLRSGGMIDYQDGGVVLTDAGRALARAPQAIRNADVQAAMLAKVKPAQQKLMEVLIREYPNHVTKEWLAAQVQMEPTGGGFNNYLGALRSLHMLDYPVKGHVCATDFLFPETGR